MSINNSDNELENEADLDADMNHTQHEDEDINEPDEYMYKKEEKDIDGISKENWVVLEKVKSTQRQEHMKVRLSC